MGTNKIGAMEFTDEDRCQFHQLIGYSTIAYQNLPYVSPSEASAVQIETDRSMAVRKIEKLTKELDELKQFVTSCGRTTNKKEG
jgi:hypothetical protein